jgi:hypothetical protein
VYMHKRIHSSLGYLTPAEFEEQWREECVLTLEFELRTAQKVSNFWGSVQWPVVWNWPSLHGSGDFDTA